MTGYRIARPVAVHDLESIPIRSSGQIFADARPTLPTVIAPENDIGAEVKPLCLVRTDQQWSVPVPAPGRIVLSLNRFDADRLTRGRIVADQPAVLGLGINDIRILRIHLGFKTIACIGHCPVGIQDPVLRGGTGRTFQREVVLCPTVDVVKGLGIVRTDAVELSDRQVGRIQPGAHAVIGLVESSVATHAHMIRIRRVDPEAMVVHMLELFGYPVEICSTVRADVAIGIHRIDHILIRRMRDEFSIVIPRGMVSALLGP